MAIGPLVVTLLLGMEALVYAQFSEMLAATATAHLVRQLATGNAALNLDSDEWGMRPSTRPCPLRSAAKTHRRGQPWSRMERLVSSAFHVTSTGQRLNDCPPRQLT